MALSLLSSSPVFFRAMNLRFAAILPMRLACVLFYASQDSWCPVFCILAVFFFVFCLISAVFMPFLRSSPFANPLLSDKSAFYLTANHYHSEGRREAEGRQNGSRTVAGRTHGLFTAFLHPAAFVSIFASLALCCKGNGSMARGEG